MFSTTISGNIAIRLANLILSIRAQATLIVDVSHNPSIISHKCII